MNLGEAKVDDLFFILMNGPDEATGEADRVINLAVDLFSRTKPRRFDELTYGNNPNAKAVRLNYHQKSRAAHLENKIASLVEFEGKATASAQLEEYEALVTS